MSKVVKLLEDRVLWLSRQLDWELESTDKPKSRKVQYKYGVDGFVRLTVTPKGTVKVFYKERSNTHYFIQATFKEGFLTRVECEYSDDIDHPVARKAFAEILLRIIGQAFPPM
jgi:PhoPQ-activated pathogenicity-related protein